MQIWITFTLINIIHQTHVSAAPVDSTFGNIAHAIINPAWTFNNTDSPKKDNEDTDLNKKNDENLPITEDGEIDYPNTKNKKKNNSRKKNKRNGKKRNNNKRRGRNNGKRNNTKRNGRYLWYNVFTMDDLLVNLPEYRNHEDEQKFVLIWDDKRRIVQNEHVDALSMNNLNNNQIIRQKRDYNNILKLQDNILQTRNINQHVSKENENSMSRKSNENTNEKMEFLNLRNSNPNKFKNILQNRKHPINTVGDKISRPNLAQGLGITLGADNSEKESQQNIIKENPQQINTITTLSNDKIPLIIGDNTSIEKNIPVNDEIETIMNAINSNSEEGQDDQNSESNTPSLKTKQEIQNYSDIVDNKQHDIIKKIKRQFKTKSRKLGKKQPKNNDKGTLQTRFTTNVHSINQQKTPSKDIPDHKIEGNTNIAKNIPVNDEIDTLMNIMNSKSEEDSIGQYSDSNQSSLEKQQDTLDFSDIGNNKEKNLFKSIKQPLKPISKIQRKTLLENNEKLPEIYEKYLNYPSEINTKKEEASQQKGNTPYSESINNQQKPSIIVPGHITPEQADVTKNIPVHDEIGSLMNIMNSKSEEDSIGQNSDSNPSSLEKQQDTLDFSDIGNNKEKNLLKSIKQPLKPISKIQRKTLLENNEKLPEIYEKYLNYPSEINTKKEEVSQQKGNTPYSESINNQQKPSIIVPGHITPEQADFTKNIPVHDEIGSLMNIINSKSEEDSIGQNSDSNPSSLEKQQDTLDFSDIGNNKEKNLLKSIKQPLKPISKIEGNTNIAKNIPVNDEIDTLMNIMNSKSEEDSIGQYSDSNQSSLEKQQDTLDFSDIGNNKEKNLLKSIKQPLKPISKIQRKTLLENNEKLPEIYEKYLNYPSEINTKKEEASQQKGNTPYSESINNQQKPSIIVPGHITPEQDDVTKNIPVHDEIGSLMNIMNSKSEEDSIGQNSDSNPSSLEKQQDTLDFSDIGNTKEKNLLKSIKQPLKPISKIQRKTLLENNEKLPEIYEKYLNYPSEINTKKEEASQQKGNTPYSESINNQQKPSIIVPGHITPEQADFTKNIPVHDEIGSLMNIMNSKSEEDSIGQNSDSNPSSLEKQQDTLDFSDIGNNKEKNLLKSIKQPLKPISKIQRKTLLENNEKLPEIYEKYLNYPSEINTKKEEGSQQKGNTPYSESINNQQKPSIIVPGHFTPEQADVTKNIPVHDEIGSLMNIMNSKSEEDSIGQNSDSNPSSLEKQQDTLDFSDIGNNKEKNLLKSIKQPLKPISKIQRKTLLENNEKLPEIYEKYLNYPSEINTKKEEASQQKGNTPYSESINNQQKPSIIVPGHITPEQADFTKNIPVHDEIGSLMNIMNSKSEEDSIGQNSDSNPSSLEKQQDTLDFSDIGNNKEKNLLKSIKQPLKPISKIQRKTLLENNEKLPEIYEKYLNYPSEINTKKEEASQQKGNTPYSESINNQQKPSIIVPGHITPEQADFTKNIPVHDEIGSLMNIMNSKSEEDSIGQNSDSNLSSLEKQQDTLDFSDIGNNKKKNLLKSIKQPLKPISKIQRKTLLENNEKLPEIYEKYLNYPSEINTKKEEGSQQKGNTPYSESINNQQKPSIIVPGHFTPEQADVTKNIPVHDEIGSLMNIMNSKSEEDSIGQNSDSNPSSLEKQQDTLDFSDIGNNKEKNLLKSIKQPLKPISKIQRKTLLENNEKLPEIYEKYLNYPSEINTKKEEASQQKGNTPYSESINNQQKPSIIVPGHITPEQADFTKNIPVHDEIGSLMNIMNSKSEEDSIGQNSDSNPSSLEKQQDTLDFSDIGNNKEKNLLKSIKQPLKPISKIQRKTLLENNEKLPEIYEKYLNYPSEINTKKEEASQQKGNTPYSESINNQQKPSIIVPGHITPEQADFTKNIPVHDEIGSLMNIMNSKSEEDSIGQNSDSNLSSLEKQQDTLDFSDIGNNKKKNLLKSIKQPLKPISKIQRKTLLENNEKLPEIYEKYLNYPSEINTKKEEASQQKGNTPYSESINNQQKPSIIVPGHITPEQADFTKNIPVHDEIGSLMNIMNSKSEEDSIGQNSDSNLSSLEKQQDTLDFSDIGNNKKKNLLKSIKQPLKPISKIQRKTLLENNEKLPEIYEKYLNYPSEINTKKEEGSQQKGNTPYSESINNQQKPSIIVPGHITPEQADFTKNIPVHDEIGSLMNIMNSKSEEDSIGQNSDSNPSSLEKQQDTLDFSDIGNNKEKNLLKSIKQPLKPISKIQRKTLLENNEKLPEIYEKYLNYPSEINTKKEEASQQKGNTPYSESINNQQKPSIIVPGHITPEQADFTKNIPVHDEIGSLMNIMNSKSEEDSIGQNSDSNPSSLEKQQDNLDFSDIGNNKEKNLLKSIKQPLKPISKIQRKTLKPEIIHTTVPKSTEKINEFSIESPSNVIDVFDPLGKYNTLGGFTIEDASLEKIKDESSFSTLNSNGIRDQDDSVQVTNQPVLMKSNTVNSNTENKVDVNTNIEEIPTKLTDGDGTTELIDKFGSNTHDDLFGGKLDSDEDLSLPGLINEKVIPMSKTNDILKNKEDYKLKAIATNNNDKSNTIQKNKKIKTPEIIHTTVPKSTEKINEFSIESPSNVIDVFDPLGKYNTLGGFTIEDASLEKIKDESSFSTLNSNGIRDQDDSVPVTNQPVLMKSNTVNSNTENKVDVNTNIEEIPTKLTDGDGTTELIDKFGSNTHDDLFGGKLDSDEDLSLPGLINEKVIPMSKTNDILKNKEDYKLKAIATNNNDKSNTIQKNKKIKTPEIIHTTVPKSTEKINEFSIESPSNVIDVFDPLGKYNTLGGFTIEDASLEKIKDESSFPTLNSNGIRDQDDSVQVTNQPVLMKSNTVNSNTENKVDVNTNIEEIPTKLTDGDGTTELIDKFGSNTHDDLFGGKLDSDEDLSLPGLIKEKVIPMSKTNDILKNEEDDKLKAIATNNDDKSNTIQKNKKITTPEIILTTVPKSTEKKNEFSIESPLNVIDVFEPLGKYNTLGGFTIEDASLEKIKDESSFPTLNSNGIRDHDDSVQVTNQPVLMKSNTVNSNTENKVDVNTNIEEIPTKLSDGDGTTELIDKFGSNTYDDLFGGKLDSNEDLSLPGLINEKVIPMSKTNDILKNEEDDKLKAIATNNDDKSNTIQKNKKITTPEIIHTTVPKSTEKKNEFSIESPLNVIDVFEPLGKYNTLGGFTIEDASLEKIKDESSFTTLNSNGIRDHDDSVQVTNQPVLMKSNTVNSNTENKVDVNTNIEEIPTKLSDGDGTTELIDKFGSNTYDDLFGGKLDSDEDLSLPGLIKEKVIPKSKTNDILKNKEEDKLKAIATNNDDKSNTIQKNKKIKTPEIIHTTVPKTTEKINEFSIESPLNVIDVFDPQRKYNTLGEFTIEDASLEKIKDESSFPILNSNRIRDQDDSVQVTNQPVLMKSNTVNSNTENKVDVNTNIEENPTKLSDGDGTTELIDKFGSNTYDDLFGGKLDTDEDLSLPGLIKEKVIPMSKTNDILKNKEEDKLKAIATNNDDKSNTIQKNKKIKTPEIIHTTAPKSTEKINEFSIESPSNVIDVFDPLGKYNTLGGFTIEDASLEKIKDESSFPTLNSNGIRDQDDSVQVTNQPVLMKSNTVNSNTENKVDVNTNIEEIPTKLSDGDGTTELIDKFGSNTYDDLFGGKLDSDEDLSLPGLINEKVIPMSKTNDILKNKEDYKLKAIATNNNDKSNTIQKNKKIKTPEIIHTTVPKSTEKINEFSIESPSNVIDVFDPLGKYNTLGGFTIEDASLEKIKDESSFPTLNSNGIRDQDDSVQVTNQPVLMKSNTVNSNTENKVDVNTNIEEIPTKLSDGDGTTELIDKFGSNTYDDLFGGKLDSDEDLSLPGLIKEKVIPMSKTNDILKNKEEDKLKAIATNNDDKSNTIQKNKKIKTPEIIHTTAPKSTEKINEFSIESPLNVIDVFDPQGKYNTLGGFTIEDASLEKIKDESSFPTLNSNGIRDQDDSVQVTNQPVLMKSNTVNSNTENKVDVNTNIEEIPTKLSDGDGTTELIDKFGSNTYDDLFGGKLDTDEDLSLPGLIKEKVIPMSKTNDILKNKEEDKLKAIATNNDDKSNTIQKNKKIKTPEIIHTTAPKSTEKINEFSIESPLNVIDVFDPQGKYNTLGGFTIEDASLEKIKDESSFPTLNSNGIRDQDDSVQVTNQPVLMKSNTVNSNTENKVDVNTNIEEIPTKLSDGDGTTELIDKFGSNTYDDLFGGKLDSDEDLSLPGLINEKVIPMSKTNDSLKNKEDDKLKAIATNNNDKSNTIQKNKKIKTPEIIHTTVPKSTEKINEFSIESPSNVIDVFDPLGKYNTLGGFTIEDASLEKIKDESSFPTLNSNGIRDQDDSVQVTNQPVLMKSNTVNSNTENKVDVNTKIEEIPTKLSDGDGTTELIDKFGSNTYDDLFGGKLDSDEDLSLPGLINEKVIPMSKTNDILKNKEDYKLKAIATNNNDKSNTIQKNKKIKTPEIIHTTVPKSTEKINEFSIESPLNVIDVFDPQGKYNTLGGFTIEDASLEKIKDESSFPTLNSNGIRDQDDSVQVTNQPVLMKSNTVNSNTENKVDVNTNIEEIPMKLSDGDGTTKLIDKFGSNNNGDLFGGSLDSDEDLSQPRLKKEKVIPVYKTNVILENAEDVKLKPIPTNIDAKSNTIQKKKSIMMSDDMDTTVPNTNHNVNEFSPDIPFKDIDVSDSLEGLNNLKDISMEDAARERIEDKSSSSALNNYRKKNRGDSLQKINKPKLIYPATEESNTEYNVGDVTNIKIYTPSFTTEIEEMPNIFPNLDDITLKSTSTDDDNKPNSLQKNKLIKKLNLVSNTDSKMCDSIEPSIQTSYDKIKNDNKLPLSKIPFNVIDKYSSNSKTMHNYNNNLLNNDKDVTFNRSFITNRFVEYNSKDLSSLEDGDQYGYMLPKFSTKYNDGDQSNYNLWETIPPKKSNNVSVDKGYDILINDFNQSNGYTTKNNKISTHTLNENNIVTGTESVKNNYNNDKVNTDIHNKQYDDFIKKMSEQLFKKMDNIDDKLAKLDKVSHNCANVREIENIASDEPTMNNGLLTNDIPNTKPEKVINKEDFYSKTNKPIESLEINISNKNDDENEINKYESSKSKKHKNKRHKRHGRDNKKKGEKNNKINNDDSNGDDDDSDDDDDDDEDDDENDNDNDDDNHKNNKRHKHKDKHNDDNGKHKKNKNDDGKHKKNKLYKKNKKINDDNDNGGHRMKSHKKKYSKVDNDVISKHKKHKNHKKKNKNYNDFEISRSKKTDNKKKKKLKENVYSPEESNDVNYSSSIQINSENNDSVKRYKTTSSKSKNSKKTNSTKSKKSSPKKKSKYVKHSKTIKYKNKEIPVDVSDEDTSSNENNYNSEKTYIKYISNNNQNNVPKDKKHKHKKHNKHSKTSKTYIYKKIPEDKDSDENSVDLEETYNINIISDDDTLKQKKHRHKKNKKKKNFDINIVKDTNTDTDTQVLNNDKKTQNGFQFYTFYPQYRYSTLNPFTRLLNNSYLR